MANSIRLELICRLLLGLFVGFFCITAVLFVRYKSANPIPQMNIEQAKGRSQASSASAAAVPLSSVSTSQPATPLLDSEQKTLITSSTSTLVAFIAAVVANLLSWRNRRRGRPPRKTRTPPSNLWT